MKKQLQIIIINILLLLPFLNYAQAPNLGKANQFVLFTANGPISNTGISRITGDVGTNNGSSTAFGNVNGVMHDGDSVSITAAADLLIAYNFLDSRIPTFFPSSLLGNGDTLIAGVYSLAAASTLNGNLILDAQGDANALFIIQIEGPLASSSGAKVKLINNALACNVYWKVEGMVSLASNTTMRGTIIANNSAIQLSSNDTLEGRAFSTTGAITIDGVLIDKPIGCGSTLLTGPAAPTLGKAECYSIFSSSGALANVGDSYVTGDVGSNSGAVSGFDPLLITGMLHPLPDVSTAMSANDLLIAYTYTNTLAHEIELLYPAQFGNGLVLTPHTYLLAGATTFTDSLYLDAQNNADAVFVIKINGALSTSTYAKVLLLNGAKAENVYWKVEGAVNIADYSKICGTIIANNAAASSMAIGVELKGRILITSGALTTNAVRVEPTFVSANCTSTGLSNQTNIDVASVNPNPFNSQLTIQLKDVSETNKYSIVIYNSIGQEILKSNLLNASMSINTEEFKSGIYYYYIMNDNTRIQSGKLINR